MEKNKADNYADLFLSMSLDYKQGKIDQDHYSNMIGQAAKSMGVIPYDSEADTLKHIYRVSNLLSMAAAKLLHRARVHDKSKLGDYEKSFFDEMTPQLAESTYGSDEYKRLLDALKPALDHHYKNNSHHPEHYPGGIDDMDLFDLMEMFFDWKAASERHVDGNIRKSIDHNEVRFGLSAQLVNILHNTAERLGYYYPNEEAE